MASRNSKRNLLRQLSDMAGLAEVSEKILGAEPPPVDLTGTWECTKTEGESGKILEALKVPFLKRKTAASPKGQTEKIEAKGRRQLIITETWSPSEGGKFAKFDLKLDGSAQKLRLPTGAAADANVEWEDDVVVGYFQGKHGLEVRRYLREGFDQVEEMCVEYRATTANGAVSAIRVFTRCDPTDHRFNQGEPS
tara:strand:- start:223 stop:804 length:582 start_codon:yes stop_codon:yes gene_type:complete